ncbi:DUF4179 domain-containing protein [Psychrobacillus sp. INOP01]|uniref:DUF4179 domain-containing protein n=1 Tax=Psychrobacillus sp. INOP01 TaxID=2829187 RepID=UPI001BAC1D05|nr:DUF4179 domain-containing protein [Psychrobacillus sp. INOP01]QUG42307.1 DUF4179 domain-containing protein [Psychrobacillus sp. INOP01]
MSKQWPDLKKEMDKISVPLDKLDSIISNTLKPTKKKKSIKRMTFYFVSAAILIIGIFISTASVSPAMAKIAAQVPIIGAFFNDVQDEGLKIAGQKGLTQVVDQSAKDNGISLTMNEIFYDGTRLTFGYTQESLFAIGELERPNIKVNGKEINFSSSSSGDFVTPQKYKGMMDINPTEELPEEFDISIRIDAIGLVPGKWEFNFPVKQSNKVTVIRPEKVITIDKAEVKISSLKLGPAGTDLAVQVIAREEESKIDPFDLNFFVVDEHENVLDAFSSSGHGDTEDGMIKAKLDFLFNPLKEGVKKVSVIPYTFAEPNGGLEEVSVDLNKKIPFTLSQGDFGNILIKDIQYKKDQTIVYFDVQSDEIYDNRLYRNPIWLKDASGNNLMLEDAPFAERIEGNSFKQVFKANEQEGLQLGTFKYPKPVTYEAFEIELPQ